MASWISRTLARLAQPAPAPAEPLSDAELRKVLDSGQRLISAGEFAEARATLRAAVLSNPYSADALVQYAAAAYLGGDPAEARLPLLQAVRIDPQHLLGQKFLAAVSNALGDLAGLEVASANAIRLAPRDFETLNFYGVACMNRLQVQEAATCFCTALEIAPNNMMSLINIDILSTKSLIDRRLLESGPKIAAARTQAINRLRAAWRRGQLDDEGLKNLLLMLAGSGDTFATAIEIAREAAKREDFTKELSDQLAAVAQFSGDLPGLLRYRRYAAEIEPNLPMVQAYLAYANLMAGYGQWREGWRKIREDEHYANLGIYAREVPPWTGQRIGKKKILVYQEQGIGDAILALRLIPMLASRGIRFDLWVVPAFASLAGSIKGYENLIRSPSRPDPRTLGCEYASTLFGLISALGVEHRDMIVNPTVLVPSPDRMPAARARLRALAGRRIGLAYGGNPDRRDDWFRAVQPAALKPLAALEGISWVSLVIDNRPDKPEVIKMFQMEDPMAEAKDFEDTAAIVSELDAVIAIDSSVAHLSCSLGKPVWVLVPPMLDWRWQIGDDTRPWWPNATLLRSPAMGKWDGVIEELARQVRTWL
jgi:tetratricopeptide (TPR) repeat protein